jgi:methoxymalonate biosynthesis acyl carrier protein
MQSDGIEQSIIGFLRDHFGVEVADSGTDLIESGILDSAMVVDLVLYLEERFAVTVALEDLEFENFATIESIAGFVAARHGTDASVGGRSG